MRRGLFFALVSLLVLLGWTGSAEAHGTGVSRGDYAIDGRVIHVALVFRAEELRATFGDRPTDVAALVDLEGDGARCPISGEPTAAPDPPDGTRVSFDLVCADAPARVRIVSRYVERFSTGHTAFLTVTRGGQKSEAIAILAKLDADVDVGHDRRPFGTIVRVGVEHILTGYDHLTFLFALLLVPASDAPRRKVLGGLLGVLTAFTIGHTLSLAIASLGGFAPSPRVVEPAIALSIAYVAAENFFVKGWRHRWALTFPFGLVHGFGFAGGLLDLAVDRADLPRALFAFNLGVELGQLGVLALALPAVLWAQRSSRYPALRRGLSALIVALGLVWFVHRVAFGG